MSDLFDQLSQIAKRGVAAQRAADGIISQPIVHHKDPITSHIAADKMVESGALSRQEAEVWQEIYAFMRTRVMTNPLIAIPTFTARELSHWSGLDYFLIQRRLSGLRNHGKIERTGEKRDGCMVWRIR